MKQDLLDDLRLCRDGDNTSSGDRGLVPRKRSFKEEVELWKGQRISLLLRRNTILGVWSSTSSCIGSLTCDGDDAQTSL
jgi:hypothetical protein